MPKLRSAITPQDIEILHDAHRLLCGLSASLHPSSGWSAPLFAAQATVRACAVEWTGKSDIWGTANVRLGQAADTSGLAPASPYLREIARDYGYDLNDAVTVRRVIAEMERSILSNDDPDTARDAIRELRERLALIYKARKA